MKRIPVAQPTLGENEKKYVMDCMETTWISSVGKYISLFEEQFAAFCQVKHAIACNNGTTALHLALVALGVGPGDEVIIPTVTYIATANCVKYCHATPVLVDVEPGTMNIDPACIEAKITSKTKGIIPVHLYGHAADMDAINAIAKKHNLFVLEDAAEAHGATVGNKRVGALGTCATFSFFGNKILTTGEGGMVTTNDDELAQKLRLFRGQGMDPNRRYWFPVIGYNYRMTNIQAAIGLGQMERVETALLRRKEMAHWYDEALACLTDHIELPCQAHWAGHVYWMYNIFLKGATETRRDWIMSQLDQHGIETRPVFYPLHCMPPYFEERTYAVADSWACRGINLPSHEGLSREDIQRIAKTLQDALLVIHDPAIPMKGDCSTAIAKAA